jgi:hypothetical protein
LNTSANEGAFESEASAGTGATSCSMAQDEHELGRRATGAGIDVTG